MKTKLTSVKIKLTNDILDQVTFKHFPVGVDAKGKLLTIPHVGRQGPNGNLLPPEPYIVRDTEMLGFGIRVSPKSVSFFVQRKMGGSSSPRRTLGKYGREFRTVAEARAKAQIWFGLMASGKDPLVLKKEQQKGSRQALERMRNTFGKAFEQFIEYKQSGALSSKRDREYVKEKLQESALWKASLDDITTNIVEKTFRPWFEKGNVATGWKLYRSCRAAYGIATGKPGHDRTNPFTIWRAAADLPVVPVRDGHLPTKKPEGAIWLKKLMDLRNNSEHIINVAADYLMCVLFWGGRKTETQLLSWQDVNFEDRIITFQARNTKNKDKHAFPMTPYVEALLRKRKDLNGVSRWAEKNTEHIDSGDWVFPSRVRGKHIVDIRRVLAKCQEASGLNITTHDLRRTFATQLASQTDLSTVKLAMNHTNAKRDVTWGYVQDKIELLRPLYEARENYLLQLAGLRNLDIQEGAETSPPIDLDVLKSQLRDVRVRNIVLRAILEAQENE